MSTPKVHPAEAPGVRRPRKTLTLILVSDEYGGALEGLTEADRDLVLQFSPADGPTYLYRVIQGARAAGYAVLIRSDLPAID